MRLNIRFWRSEIPIRLTRWWHQHWWPSRIKQLDQERVYWRGKFYPPGDGALDLEMVLSERRELPKQWVIVLDDYEAVNLAAVLNHIAENAPTDVNYNTGDWLNQIRWKMPHKTSGMAPNPIED